MTTGAGQPAFEMLHAGVQRQLWRMGWRSLRPLQERAIPAILGGEGHAILAAATAAGKTEAAFLPVLSRIADDPAGSVRAIYVGPLKALINDQFGRMEELCTYLDVPVHRWHGDVAAGKKSQLLRDPGGVLLITPESMESMFVNHGRHLERVFGGVRFVVIDELHSFLDNERGLHLRSLLHRLDGVAKKRFRIIGLSATIGDVGLAKRYVGPDRPEDVQFLEDKGSAAEVLYRVHGYSAAGDEAGMRRVAQDIVRHCAGSANLVFANAKGDVEEMAELCGRLGAEQGLRDRFLVHHGSLSAEIREKAEDTMKGGAPATAFCSSTLEMGIDIGSVRMVGQIGAPWSVASLKQRLGRSGRRKGEPRMMRVYIACREGAEERDLFDRLNLELVQAAAVTKLMLAGWVEPAVPPACDLSTLTQQVISCIAQNGGMRADALHERLCGKGAFRDIEPALFARLLRRLGEQDVIEQMEEGDLILGLRGEHLRKHAGFYAVFPTPDAYAVVHGGQVIGTLQAAHEKGDHLLFAGRRWVVEEVDHGRLELHVAPATGWKRPRFTGSVGEVHGEVRRTMREVLEEDEPLPFVDEEGQRLMDDARRAAKEVGIFDRAMVSLGAKRTALFTWAGTRVQQTLAAMFAARGVDAADETVALVFSQAEERVAEHARALAAEEIDVAGLVRELPNRRRRKYDWLLSDDLLDESLGRGWVDVEGALRAVKG